MAIKTWASGDVLTAADMNTYPLQKGVVTTKGDLLVGTTDSTVVRLAVGGTNGHVLTVDSAESTGMKWAAAAGGGSGESDQIVIAVQVFS